jgi:hypothetical protein
MNNEPREGFTRPVAEDGTELAFRPDLGADVYVHPRTQRVYLDVGDGRFEPTERGVSDLARPEAPDPGADFPTERPPGRPKYGVDLSAEGYAGGRQSRATMSGVQESANTLRPQSDPLGEG